MYCSSKVYHKLSVAGYVCVMYICAACITCTYLTQPMLFEPELYMCSIKFIGTQFHRLFDV